MTTCESAQTRSSDAGRRETLQANICIIINYVCRGVEGGPSGTSALHIDAYNQQPFYLGGPLLSIKFMEGGKDDGALSPFTQTTVFSQ